MSNMQKEEIIKYRNYNNNIYNKCMSCAGKNRIFSEASKKQTTEKRINKQLSEREPFNIEYFYAVQESIDIGEINELKTFDKFKYYSIDLLHKSGRSVFRICKLCGKEDSILYHSYMQGKGVCRSCSKKGQTFSESHRKRLSESRKGKKHSEETKEKISIIHKGKILSEETRQRSSAAHQGIPYEEWESYATDKPYCPLFNESCKESNREKYNRECFICGKLEEENITSTGKFKKLSVHHVDMNKMQGCDGHEWKLIPVCMHCHGKLHTKRMQSCIKYMLKEE
jgi:hypothetical protein